MYIIAFTRPRKCYSQPLEYSSVPQCLAYKPFDATFINSVALLQPTYRQLTRKKKGQQQQIYPGNTAKGKVLGKETGQFTYKHQKQWTVAMLSFKQERFSVVAHVSKKKYLLLMQDRWLPQESSSTTQEAKMRLPCSILLLVV